MKRKKPLPIVLSISGSDPSGGAGIEADLKTFHRHGVHGVAIPTLLTAQNTVGVRKVRFLDPDFVEEQWRVIFADFRPKAIKLGALGSRSMVLRIAKLLERKEAAGIPVVLDPVMGSTSGAVLLESSALSILKNRVFPRCHVITPNAGEFSVLSGKKIDMQNAEAVLRTFGKDKPYAILLKGGHLAGTESVDMLCQHGKLSRFGGKRLPVHAHGTGCVLASSIAANLALGRSLPAACRQAKVFVHRALTSSFKLGEGRNVLNLWA